MLSDIHYSFLSDLSIECIKEILRHTVVLKFQNCP